MKYLMTIIAGMALSLGFVACDKDEKNSVEQVSDVSDSGTQDTASAEDTGPAEDTGETVEDTGETVEDTGETVESVEDTGEAQSDASSADTGL